MRVGSEDYRVRLAAAELGGDFGLSHGPDVVHHLVPFAVGELGGSFHAWTWPSKLASGHR